jgi:AraC family transcriptional regulator
MIQLTNGFYKERKLQNLVENQTSFTLKNTSLHIFETYHEAKDVYLQFDSPVLASMIMGKKIMMVNQCEKFDFLPGESVIMPRDAIMNIDFPEADEKNPTKCLAMTINQDFIKESIELMNETYLRGDNKEWNFSHEGFHFTNDHIVYQIIQRLIFLHTENHSSKDIFVDMMMRELIIRILQTETYKTYTENSSLLISDNRIAHVIDFVKKNLHQPITIRLLSEKACMSESNFYKTFKNMMGLSPIDFIKKERISLAMRLLRNPNNKIKDVMLQCGFESRSYFNRLFKNFHNFTPTEFTKS